MALKSQKQHLGMLAARWVRGQQEGYISDDLHNPFKRPMPAAARKDDPSEFSVAELTAIFRLPVFTLGERPTPNDRQKPRPERVIEPPQW